eukprot:764687-Hanusia_phi.AAC.1
MGTGCGGREWYIEEMSLRSNDTSKFDAKFTLHDEKEGERECYHTEIVCRLGSNKILLKTDMDECSNMIVSVEDYRHILITSACIDLLFHTQPRPASNSI